MKRKHAARERDEVAFFTRNWECYIDDACKIAVERPDKRTTFRAVTRWTTAAQALVRQTPRDLYIALIDGGGEVGFRAELHEVDVDPKRGKPKTDRLLPLVLPRTRGEGLWESDDRELGTLYSIANCRKLSRSFPMTELVKMSDGKPINADYKYSYSVVFPRPCE